MRAARSTVPAHPPDRHRNHQRTLRRQCQPRRPPPRHQSHHPLQPHGKLAPFMSLYLEHFGLREPPFRLKPDTTDFYTGSSPQQAGYTQRSALGREPTIWVTAGPLMLRTVIGLVTATRLLMPYTARAPV